MAIPFELGFTDNFLEALKRDSYLQSVQGQFTDQDLLDVVREQVVSQIVSLMIEVKRDHMLEQHDITLEAEQARYDLPRYAMYDMLNRARLVRADGTLRPQLLRASRDDVDALEGLTPSTPQRVRIEGVEIVLYPAPSTSSLVECPTLRTWIYRRPGRYVRAVTSGDELGRAVQVQSIDTGSGQVTYTGAPPSGFSDASVHDFFRGEYPFRRYVTAATALDFSDPTQRFSDEVVSQVRPGDWVCFTNETCFLQVPDEIVPAAKEMSIVALSKSKGDRATVAAALQSMAASAVKALNIIGDRFDNQPALISLRGSPFVNGIGRKTNMAGDDW